MYCRVYRPDSCISLDEILVMEIWVSFQYKDKWNPIICIRPSCDYGILIPGIILLVRENGYIKTVSRQPLDMSVIEIKSTVIGEFRGNFQSGINHRSWWLIIWNAFRILPALCEGNPPVSGGLALTKGSYADCWCFFEPEQAGQTDAVFCVSFLTVCIYKCHFW